MLSNFEGVFVVSEFQRSEFSRSKAEILNAWKVTSHSGNQSAKLQNDKSCSYHSYNNRYNNREDYKHRPLYFPFTLPTTDILSRTGELWPIRLWHFHVGGPLLEPRNPKKHTEVSNVVRDSFSGGTRDLTRWLCSQYRLWKTVVDLTWYLRCQE